MNETSNILSLMTLLLVFSLLVNLYYINGKASKWKKNKKDKNQEPLLVKKYLLDQSQKTSTARSNQSIPKLHPVIIKFRSAYLMIEAKAIDRGVGSNEYWNIINAKIKTLFDLLLNYEGNPTLKSIEKKVKTVKQLINTSDDISDKDILNSCLEKFYKACVDNSNIERLKRYDTKLNKLLLRFSDKTFNRIDKSFTAHKKFSSTSKNAINEFPPVNNEDKKSKKIFGTGNDKVNNLLDEYEEGGKKFKKTLKSFKKGIEDSDESIARLTEAKDNDDGTTSSQKSALELLELSESLQEKGDQEISHLKKVVRDQRETIYSLEHELLKTEKDPNNGDTEQEDVEKREQYKNELKTLNMSLRDAENCIEVLESELDDLKAKMDDFKEVYQEGDQNEESESVDVDTLRETIIDLEQSAAHASKEMDFLKLFHEFSQEAAKLESLEDLAMHTYACLGDLGYKGQFIIFGEDREFVVSDTGTIAPKIKTILNNMGVNETSQNAKNTMFFTRQKHLACVLSESKTEVISSAVAAQVLTFVQFTDNIMKRIVDGGQAKSIFRSLDQQCNKIKEKSQNVDQHLLKMFLTNQKTIAISLKSIEDLARSSGFTATQISRIKNYTQEIEEEIESNKTVTIKIKKAFLEILNDIERMY